MKFKEYLESLQKLAEENPLVLEMDVIYSKDDEGNGFNEVCFEPSLGRWDDEDWTPLDNFEDEELTDEDINAVCIN